MITTDNLKEMRHIVIIETDKALRIVEFDGGQMDEAHQFAANHAGLDGFKGRVIVACRVRQIGEFGYLNDRGLI